MMLIETIISGLVTPTSIALGREPLVSGLPDVAGTADGTRVRLRGTVRSFTGFSPVFSQVLAVSVVARRRGVVRRKRSRDVPRIPITTASIIPETGFRLWHPVNKGRMHRNKRRNRRWGPLAQVVSR